VQPTFGILPDHLIRAAQARGDIEIDPFNPAHVNPVSYDLTLGDELMIYKRWVHYDETYESRGPMGFATSRADAAGARNGSDFHRTDTFLDVRDEPETVKFRINPERGWILKPGIGYLMHTRERVHTKKYVPVLDGKSSIGRLFMVVHVTAGYGDPGFNGQYTLEVVVTHPLRIYPGMKIAQMRFHTIASLADEQTVGGVERLYAGNYVGDAARGPVASKAYRQFLESGLEDEVTKKGTR
jgi:dCTP deaminase